MLPKPKEVVVILFFFLVFLVHYCISSLPNILNWTDPKTCLCWQLHQKRSIRCETRYLLHSRSKNITLCHLEIKDDILQYRNENMFYDFIFLLIYILLLCNLEKSADQQYQTYYQFFKDLNHNLEKWMQRWQVFLLFALFHWLTRNAFT